MQAEAFIQRLRALGLLDEDSPARAQLEFVVDSSVSPLAQLAAYNLNKLSVGDCVLNSLSLDRRNPAWVGTFGGDRVVEGPFGDVWIEETGTPSHVLWKCAASGDQFLDALALAAEYLSLCLRDLGACDDQKLIRSYAERCSVEAGGLEYRDFFLVLLGSDD